MVDKSRLLLTNNLTAHSSLTEIQEWIQGIKSDRLTSVEKCEIISQKLQEIDERINELEKMKIPLVACLVKYQDET